MKLFNKKPKKRDVFLSKESGNDFPLDKKNRPLICKQEGKVASLFNAMSSKPGENKIELEQNNFKGEVKIKENGSFLNIEDDFEILNHFKRQKIGVYLGKFKEDLDKENQTNKKADSTDELTEGGAS